MSIVYIKTRWLRRTVLVIAVVPVLIAVLFLGACSAFLETGKDIITVWRK